MNQSKAIAILGYGTVGSGVAEAIRRNSDILEKKNGFTLNVKHILDLREFPEDPFADRMTSDLNVITGDPEVVAVCETIGGVGFAYEASKAALAAGKHVVTSNKELVATHGAELMRLAAEHKVSYQFEASVGGGIPLIRPLLQCLPVDDITRLSGILNGTTNYILTRMAETGEEFKPALRSATEKGYAELDPSDDIDGIDAARKIAILGSLLSGHRIDSTDVDTTGIGAISGRHMSYAAQIRMAVKLIAQLELARGKNPKVLVAPMLVPLEHPLASVREVFNAALATGDIVGPVMFYGQGAGQLPTASAVLADLVACCKPEISEWTPAWPEGKDLPVEPAGQFPVKALVRVKQDVKRSRWFPQLADFIIEKLDPLFNDEKAYIVSASKQKTPTVDQLVAVMEQLGDDFLGWIRFYDEHL